MTEGSTVKAIVTIHYMDNGVYSVLDDSTHYFFDDVDKAKEFYEKVNKNLEWDECHTVRILKLDTVKILDDPYANFIEKYNIDDEDF